MVIAAKVTTVGNSLGIVLPREVLARLRVDKGDVVFLVESPLGFELTPYDPAFLAQMQQVENVLRYGRDVVRHLDGQSARPTSRIEMPE